MRIRNGSEFTKVVTQSLSNVWDSFTRNSGKWIAEDFKSQLISKIEKQQFNWPPINEEYKDSKLMSGRDTRTLISSGAYISSFKVDNLGNSWRVRPSNAKHPESDLTYAQLGAVHEYGSPSRNIPPRPHWRPAVNSYILGKDVITDNLMTNLTDMVRSDLVSRLESGEISFA